MTDPAEKPELPEDVKAGDQTLNVAINGPGGDSEVNTLIAQAHYLRTIALALVDIATLLSHQHTQHDHEERDT